MKILVTGAAGLVGSHVAAELLAHDHEVRVLDKTAPGPELKGRVEAVYADITDRFALLAATQGCDAIAHLAAIPNPDHGEDHLLETNVLGTQYLLAAAQAQGVSRFVMASTCAIYGFAFASDPQNGPKYLPIGEDHPLVNQDLYALSKQCNELTAATYTRRCGISTTCLRLTYTMSFAGNRARWVTRQIDHSLEWPSRDLWAYLDVRDAARAFRLALERVTEGHHVAQVTARDLLSRHDGRVLIQRHYAHLEEYLDRFDYGTMGFWDTSRAEELLGFVPQYSWRDAEITDNVAPRPPA